MKKQLPTVADITSALDYDPITGRFKWLITSGKAVAGQLAGVVGRQGYRRIGFRGHEIPAARIAWLVTHGVWPPHEVVHENGDRLDDRIANLSVRVHSRHRPALTQQRLKQLLCYDPESGLFKRAMPSKGPKPQDGVGWTRDGGYRMITVDGRPYRAHRLAWLYVHGKWPVEHIDHINGITSDNRVTNLREASVQQNLANSKKPITNTSGYKGVSWHKAAKKWAARIRSEGGTRHLGLYETAEEAHAAYCAEAQRTKGEFARTE